MTLKLQVLAWDNHKNVAGLNRLMGSQLSPLDNLISNDNTYINKRKSAQIGSYSKKDHRLSETNNNINMNECSQLTD